MLYARETNICCVEPSNVQNDPRRLESLFHEALLKTSPQERADYLEKVCGDSPELRAEIESLLAAHEQPDRAPLLPLSGTFTPPSRSLFSTQETDREASLDAGSSSQP
jgi:hypothetical protein